MAERGGELLVAHAIQLRAGDRLQVAGQDAQLLGNGGGGVHMVARNHDRADAGAAAFDDRGLDFRAHRIDHAGQADKAQLLFEKVRLFAFRRRGPLAPGGGQHAQRAVGHVLVGGQDLPAQLVRHGNGLAVRPEAVRALLEHFVRRALGKLDDEAGRIAVDGAHHLASAVKGRFPNAGQLLLEPVLVERELGRPGDQRGLRRLAGHVAVRVQLRVGAERHGGCEQRLVLAERIDDGHAVLRQRAGLVRADDLCAAERLHSGQPADDGVAARHVRHADGEHDRDDGRKALRDGRYRKGDGHHERIHDHIGGQIARSQQLHAEDHDADAQHEPGEDFRELRELDLQRRLPVLRLRQRVRDLAHLRLHAGGGDDGASTAIYHRAAHVDHVFPVAEGHIGAGVVEPDDVDELCDGYRLARECGLFNFEAGIFNQATVCGHGVARLEQHDVAHDQLLAAHGHDFPVAQHFRGGGRHFLQRFNGLFRLIFLIDAQDGVDDDDRKDDDDVGKAFVLQNGQHAGNDCRRQQDEDHRILHLFKKTQDQRRLFGLGQFVRPVLLEACFSF